MIWVGIGIGAASVILLEIAVVVTGLIWFATHVPDDHNPYVKEDFSA